MAETILQALPVRAHFQVSLTKTLPPANPAPSPRQNFLLHVLQAAALKKDLLLSLLLRAAKMRRQQQIPARIHRPAFLARHIALNRNAKNSAGGPRSRLMRPRPPVKQSEPLFELPKAPPLCTDLQDHLQCRLRFAGNQRTLGYLFPHRF